MKRFSRVHIFSVALSLLINAVIWESEVFSQDQDSIVPDEKLAAVVREALELDTTDPITPTQLATLTFLDGYSRGIVDLTGLEHATRLTTLVLWGNSISNLTPLARLTHLRSLSLSANSIKNLYPLAGLTNLRTLVLNDNVISDLRPLARLTHLTQLYLAGNLINDVRPLAELTHLRVLYLHTNSISNVAPLTALTHLTVLGLWENSIRDLPALTDLTDLRTLYLSANVISDLRPLSTLTHLTQLYLAGNLINDVRPLAELANLKTLDLSYNFIRDVRPLTNLTHLRTLSLWGNPIPEAELHEQLREAGLQIALEPQKMSHPVEVRHRRRSLGTPCPVGWKRRDAFATPTQRVILRAVEVDIDRQNRSGTYTPVAIHIYADSTENLSDLNGWKLTLAVPYNHPTDYLLTTENSTFNANGIARIESPSETPFPMTDVYVGGQVLPGFDYRLFNAEGRRVDFGIACYRESGLAARLQSMQPPRVDRNIAIASLDWTQAYYRSEWRVGIAVVPAAPSVTVRQVLTTSWAALKKQ